MLAAHVQRAIDYRLVTRDRTATLLHEYMVLTGIQDRHQVIGHFFSAMQGGDTDMLAAMRRDTVLTELRVVLGLDDSVEKQQAEYNANLIAMLPPEEQESLLINVPGR